VGKVTNIEQEATIVNNISYFKATVSIQNDAAIRLGMSVEVRSIKATKENVLSIPIMIVQFDSRNRAYVYCLDKNGKLEKRYLTLGINDGINVEVKSGLTADETVYTLKVTTKTTSPLDMLGGDN
jgi:multidrug efflux pump subunit AcrA (membrane-fusion protein)